jgi:two-component system response regulator YesN
VNEKELNDALRRLNASFTTERQRKETASLEAERKLELMGKHAIDFLSDNEWNGTIDQFNAEYGLNLQDFLFTGLNVKFDHRELREADLKQDSLVTRNAVQLFSCQLKNNAQCLIYSISAGMNIVALVNSVRGSESKIQQTLQESFAKLKDYVYAFSEYEVTMALGPTGPFSSAHGSLVFASRGVYERIVFGTGKIILPEDLKNRKEISSLEDILMAVKLSIANAVQSFSASQLAGHIDSAFALVRDRRFYSADAYYETAIAIARQVYGQNTIMIEERLLSEEIHACWSLATLVALLKERLCAKLAELKAAQQVRSNKPIRAAISFVEEHYPERISLEDVASTLVLNPTYFSTLFKKETGMNFLTYLTEFRVEKAKDLLCTTNDTMACIAEKVGYADTRYFSQCFEKIVGVKPSLYRKMYS